MVDTLSVGTDYIHDARYFLRQNNFPAFVTAAGRSGYKLERLVIRPPTNTERSKLRLAIQDAARLHMRAAYGGVLGENINDINALNATYSTPHEYAFSGNHVFAGNKTDLNLLRTAHKKQKLEEFALVKVTDSLSDPKAAIDIIGNPLSSRHVERYLFDSSGTQDYRIIVREHSEHLQPGIGKLLEGMPLIDFTHASIDYVDGVRRLVKAFSKDPRIANNPRCHEFLEGEIEKASSTVVAEAIAVLGMLTFTGVVTEEDRKKFATKIRIEADTIKEQPDSKDESSECSRCG